MKKIIFLICFVVNLIFALNVFAETYTLDSTGDVGYYTSIAIDSNNKVHISYFEGTNYDFKYATNTSGSWIYTTLDSTGDVGRETSIAIDSNNKVHISYYDNTNFDLKYATNNAPTLSWTGEANYTSDGINPETGNTSSTFIYRVKYTDTDNDAPATNYPKVHIKKAGVEITGSPFTMSYVSGSYSSGAIYTYSTTLSTVGTDYTYYFEAQDIYSAVATGTPTSAVDAPDVNNVPTLSWTGETSYTSDGLNPERGNASTSFVYRVKYTDTDNDTPASGYPKVHIKKAGAEISGSPFTMTYASGSNSSGAIYTYSTTLKTGADYTYDFEAKDVDNNVATGTPLTSVDTPDVNIISADEDTTIITEDGTQIDVPKDTLNPGVTINVNIPTSVPQGEIPQSLGSVKGTNVLREITVSDGTKQFRNNIKITIPFKESDIVGITKSNLKLFYYLEEKKIWVLILNSSVNTSNNTVSASVNHFTIFRIMAIEVSSAKLVLYNNLFNPAKNEKCYIRYDLANDGDVNISVYTIMGEKIKELLNTSKTSGSYTDLTWDGKNEDGEVVASGLYFVYIKAGEFKEKKKCVIVR